MVLKDFKNGFRDALPVCILYFGVSVSLGISCADIGMNWIEASLMSLLNVTSAGEFAAIGIMGNHGSFGEIAISQLVINLRYLLMSAALVIKLKPQETIKARLLMSYGITDEIFGLSVSQKELTSSYTIGAFCMAVPGWIVGTCLGDVLGNILPEMIVTALSMAIYAMFISIVLLPARKDNILLFVEIATVIISGIIAKLIPSMSSGIRVVVLTVVISSLAAWIFPKSED